MKVNIKNKEIVKVADVLEILSITVNLDSSATVMFALQKDGYNVEVYNFKLTKEQYDAWGSDDNYIINLIFQEFGLEAA